jgi:outer membrane protein assembly factor BamE (lipoprotein component of BamABCDE complex)
MKKNMMWVCLLAGLVLVVGALSLSGCSREQAPAPAVAPPAPTAAPPAGTPSAAPTTTPAGPAQPGTAINPLQAMTQVQMGMTPEQVQNIMGPATQTKQKGTKLEWEYLTPGGKVEIEFLNNQVSSIEKH